MGKAKVKMERINDKKSRNLTFKRRKDGLSKKLDELTKLCDIKACMVIRYQENGNSDLETHVWPPNYEDFSKTATELYGRNQNSGTRATSSGACEILTENVKKVDEEIKNVSRRDTNTEFLNSMTEEELRALAIALGKKSEMIKSKMESLKFSPSKNEGLGFSAEPLCRREESLHYLKQKGLLGLGGFCGGGIGVVGNIENFNYCQLDQPQLQGLGFSDRGRMEEFNYLITDLGHEQQQQQRWGLWGGLSSGADQLKLGSGVAQNQSQIEDVSWYSNMLMMGSSIASLSSATSASASGFCASQNQIISSDLANYHQQQHLQGIGGMGLVWDAGSLRLRHF